jgi:putative ABC transport system permease protein
LKTIFSIITNAFLAAFADIKANKFRTFLSLFGITIGIFCIIGVLSAINSLDRNIKKDLSSIGNNTIFVSKWQWGTTSNDYPFWKYAQRPSVTLNDALLLQQNSKNTALLSYTVSEQATIEKNNNIISPVNLYGTTEQFLQMQNLNIGAGRFITQTEFESAASIVVIGIENANKMFGNSQNALNQTIAIKGKPFLIVGVLQFYGKNILQGWDYDNCAIIPYLYHEKYFKNRRLEPFLMAKAKTGIATSMYISELKGILRGIRKLQPGQDDNFSLNDINIFSDKISSVTKYVQLGGSVIAFFSLVVGAFGIANIMFVTVKERTKIIGLKKAIGAKPIIIKLEFLLESAFLCLCGGFFGLILLFFTSIFLSKVFGFAIEIRIIEVLLTILICTIIGILSGYIPANKASKMNAVDAIRST